jgi:hypothetical protein
MRSSRGPSVLARGGTGGSNLVPSSSKLGIRDEDGSVIAFPYMPRVADLPRRWRHWSPAEKIEHLLGMTLDEMAEITLWPIAERDPFRLSVKLQVIRIVFAIGAKALLDGKLGREAARERDRQCALEELTLREFGTGDEA